MENNKYEIEYLHSFSEDLNEILYYVSYRLKNKKAAEKLLKKVEKSIINRSKNPECFEAYKKSKNGEYTWYRIYVGNFTILYTIKDNIMQIVRMIYSKRNIDDII